MSNSETRFAVLLFSDIVGSTDLKQRHGVPAFAEALRVHNAHFERAAGECRGIRILQNMGDGYFAEGDSVSEVVKFALLFQDAMRAGPHLGVERAGAPTVRRHEPVSVSRTGLGMQDGTNCSNQTNTPQGSTIRGAWARSRRRLLSPWNPLVSFLPSC